MKKPAMALFLLLLMPSVAFAQWGCRGGEARAVSLPP